MRNPTISPTTWTKGRTQNKDGQSQTSSIGSMISLSRKPKRKLFYTTIMHADIANYAGMMCKNEELTYDLVNERLDIVTAEVLANDGVVCHFAGDAILANFSNPLTAVYTALKIQKKVDAANQSLIDEFKMKFRIGLHAANVYRGRGEIFGTGVNIAVRLQSIGRPGGVCVSDSIINQLRDTKWMKLINIGPTKLKNINRRVRVIHIELATLQACIPTQSSPHLRARQSDLGLSSMRNLRMECLSKDEIVILTDIDQRFVISATEGAPP